MINHTMPQWSPCEVYPKHDHQQVMCNMHSARLTDLLGPCVESEGEDEADGGRESEGDGEGQGLAAHVPQQHEQPRHEARAHWSTRPRSVNQSVSQPVSQWYGEGE